MNAEVGLLRDLVKISSVTGQEEKIAHFIVTWAQNHSLSATIDDVGNVIVQAGKGDRNIVLLGHLDTVPGDIPVKERDRKLYGRGSVDAKGPLATFLCALLRVKEHIEGKRILVIGAVEEEGSSKGARHLCGTIHPDLTIIGEPSGFDAITLGYKGSLRARFTLSGEVVHGAAKEEGTFEKALGLYSELRAWINLWNKGKKRMARVELHVHDIETNRGSFKDEIVLHLRFRLPFGYDSTALKDKMLALAGDGVLAFLGEEQPYLGEKRNALVSAFMRAMRAEGLKPRLKTKTGTSDMNILGPHFKVPTLAFGPGDSSLDHTPNEHIELDEYLKAIDILERVLLEL